MVSYENDRIRRFSTVIAHLRSPAWHEGIRVWSLQHVSYVGGPEQCAGVRFAMIPYYVLHRPKGATKPVSYTHLTLPTKA